MANDDDCDDDDDNDDAAAKMQSYICTDINVIIV